MNLYRTGVVCLNRLAVPQVVYLNDAAPPVRRRFTQLQGTETVRPAIDGGEMPLDGKSAFATSAARLASRRERIRVVEFQQIQIALDRLQQTGSRRQHKMAVANRLRILGNAAEDGEVVKETH